MSARVGRRLRVVGDQPPAHVVAVQQTFADHSEKMWRSLRAFTGDPDVASDAVAEAFAQLLRRGPGVHDPAAWAWRTAFRIANGELKTRSAFVSDELLENRAAPADPDVVDLLRGLSQLSRNQRLAVVLHDYAGFTSGYAAELAGSTEAAMRVHLLRGRRRLRGFLDDSADVDLDLT